MSDSERVSLVPNVTPAVEITPIGIYRYEEEDSQYACWRRWRYEHISIEFQLETHRMAEVMWKQKRPWWLGSFGSW